MLISEQNIVITLIVEQNPLSVRDQRINRQKYMLKRRTLGYWDIIKFCLRALLFISIHSINFKFG